MTCRTAPRRLVRARLAHGLSYFDTVLGALGMRDQSPPSPPRISDEPSPAMVMAPIHGWGGHHFVMGGSVKGGDIWRFPTLGVSDGRTAGPAPTSWQRRVLAHGVGGPVRVSHHGPLDGPGRHAAGDGDAQPQELPQKDLGFTEGLMDGTLIGADPPRSPRSAASGAVVRPGRAGTPGAARRPCLLCRAPQGRAGFPWVSLVLAGALGVLVAGRRAAGPHMTCGALAFRFGCCCAPSPWWCSPWTSGWSEALAPGV